MTHENSKGFSPRTLRLRELRAATGKTLRELEPVQYIGAPAMPNDLTIPCLSLWQPWAGLLFHGKDVENRSWETLYRGPLLIHAAKRMDTIGFGTGRQLYYRHLHPHSPEKPSQKHFDQVHSKLTNFDSVFLEQGAILGVVNLVGCKRWYQGTSMWHCPGQFGWYLENPVQFKAPIPYRGRQRLFRVPIDALPCEAVGQGKIIVALRLKAMHLNSRSPCSTQLKLKL